MAVDLVAADLVTLNTDGWYEAYSMGAPPRLSTTMLPVSSTVTVGVAYLPRLRRRTQNRDIEI